MRRFGSLLSVLAMLCVAVLAAAPAAAEKRVALVVGMSNYKHVGRLANPANDARLIADTLRGLGFTLVGGGAQLDLDKAALDRVVQSFGSLAQGADVGLVYYAGHGVQVKGLNYLIPVDANPVKEADIDFQMMEVTLVLRQMEASGTRLNMVIFDACRNNPFAGRGLRAMATGLAPVQAPEGTVIAFAAQPGSVALDGNDGNSPYAKALAQMMPRPGIGIFKTFQDVGLAVKKATGAQDPWTSYSTLNGDFYFAGQQSAAVAAPQAVAAPSASQQATLAPPAQPTPSQSTSTPPVSPQVTAPVIWGDKSVEWRTCNIALTANPQSSEVEKKIESCTFLIQGGAQSTEDRALAYFSRGIIYLENIKDYDRAIADFSESIRLRPELNRYASRGEAYSKKKDYDRAIADLSRAIEIDPVPGTCSKCYEERALAYEAKGDRAKARADRDNERKAREKRKKLYGFY